MNSSTSQISPISPRFELPPVSPKSSSPKSPQGVPGLDLVNVSPSKDDNTTPPLMSREASKEDNQPQSPVPSLAQGGSLEDLQVDLKDQPPLFNRFIQQTVRFKESLNDQLNRLGVVFGEPKISEPVFSVSRSRSLEFLHVKSQPKQKLTIDQQKQKYSKPIILFFKNILNYLFLHNKCKDFSGLLLKFKHSKNEEFQKIKAQLLQDLKVQESKLDSKKDSEKNRRFSMSFGSSSSIKKNVTSSNFVSIANDIVGVLDLDGLNDDIIKSIQSSKIKVFKELKDLIDEYKKTISGYENANKQLSEAKSNLGASIPKELIFEYSENVTSEDLGRLGNLLNTVLIEFFKAGHDIPENEKLQVAESWNFCQYIITELGPIVGGGFLKSLFTSFTLIMGREPGQQTRDLYNLYLNACVLGSQYNQPSSKLELLGSGSTASVYVGSYTLPNGQVVEKVFKPFSSPIAGPGIEAQLAIINKSKLSLNIARSNEASCAVAKLLGKPELLVDSSLGLGYVCDEFGNYLLTPGIVMDKAEGHPILPNNVLVPLMKVEKGSDLEKNLKRVEWGNPDFKNSKFYNNLMFENNSDPELAGFRRIIVDGEFQYWKMQRIILSPNFEDPQLISDYVWLHLIDLLSNQIDRNKENKRIVMRATGDEKNPYSLSLVAIDHDISFGSKSVIEKDDVGRFRSESTVKSFLDQNQKLGSHLPLFPQVLDTEMEEKILEITEENLRASLACLDDEEKECAVRQLKRLQDYCRQLRASNSIIDPSEWGANTSQELLKTSLGSQKVKTSYWGEDFSFLEYAENSMSSWADGNKKRMPYFVMDFEIYVKLSEIVKHSYVDGITTPLIGYANYYINANLGSPYILEGKKYVFFWTHNGQEYCIESNPAANTKSRKSIYFSSINDLERGFTSRPMGLGLDD